MSALGQAVVNRPDDRKVVLMLWVTRSRIHLDRVASPWLVDRFVDEDPTFGFLDEGEEVPDGAIPMTLPGAELSARDENGSTFRKILRKHDITDPVLVKMAECVEAGMAFSLHEELPDFPEDIIRHAKAMSDFSEGMAVLYADDHENIRLSFPFYDALYINIWADYGDAGRTFPEHPRKRIDELQEARDWPAFFKGVAAARK